MKTSLALTSLRFAGIIACSSFILSSCVAHAAAPESTQPSSTTTKEALPTTKTAAQKAATTVRDAISDAWEKSKEANFKQREAVRERMKSAEAALDAKILDWTAKKDVVVNDAKPAVTAAHKEVTEAREVLSQKINALDNATEETWSSVKSELSSAWQRMTTAASDLVAKLNP